MNIGIDIDNTLTNTSIVSNTLVKEDKLYHGVLDYHDLNKEEAKDFLSKYLEQVVWNIDIKDDALEVLKYWKNKGYKLIFITARGVEETNNKSNIKSIYLTSLYFISKGITFDELVFFQENKGITCKKYNLDLFIDDKERVLDDVKKAGIKTLRITDDKVMELVGEDIGCYFSDMSIVGVINEDPNFEMGWFNTKQYVDTQAGQMMFCNLLRNIVLNK